MPLGGPDWNRPACDLTAATAPAFKLKPGRVAVLALSNPGPQPMVFHLHGHWFRLLDRLDDGWKPFGSIRSRSARSRPNRSRSPPSSQDAGCWRRWPRTGRRRGCCAATPSE
ncbi:MAG: multicopper oxidase domain-containing protein [Rhodopseudomonas palustris]|nr:multicopper oxidase domain-containing protein [Rhodopseudomonas palustris]